MIVAARSRAPVERDGLVWRGVPFAVLLALAFRLFLVGSPRHWWYFLAAASSRWRRSSSTIHLEKKPRKLGPGGASSA
jgi:hypothetical protein